MFARLGWWDIVKVRMLHGCWRTELKTVSSVHFYLPQQWSYHYTRMHSSRMHTVRCSDRLGAGGGGLPGWMCVSAQEGVWPGESSHHAPRQTFTPLVNSFWLPKSRKRLSRSWIYLSTHFPNNWCFYWNWIPRSGSQSLFSSTLGSPGLFPSTLGSPGLFPSTLGSLGLFPSTLGSPGALELQVLWSKLV